MNKEKISSQEIIDLVATKASVSKRAAEEFLKVMITTIEEALMAGDVVKIKGFGTFKLQWNEPRKSVNVQTGEEMVLDGYHKVAFAPETTLKDLVNEPFAHLEAVQLDGENESVSPIKPDEVALDPLRIFTEQATEIKDLLSEIQALSTKPQSVVESELTGLVEDVGLPVPVEFELLDNEDEIEDVDILQREPEVLAIDESIQIVSSIDENIVQEDKSIGVQKNEDKVYLESGSATVLDSEAVLDETQLLLDEIKSVYSNSDEQTEFVPAFEPSLEQNEDVELESTPYLVGAKPMHRMNKWILASIILFVLIGGSAGLYLFYPPVTEFGRSAVEKSAYEISYFKNIAIPNAFATVKGWFTSDSIKKGRSVGAVVPKIAKKSVLVKVPVDTLKLLLDGPRVYEEYIATEQIDKSSKLTTMSEHYYGSKDFWVYIYEANIERIENPDVIQVGTLIRIPKLDSRLIDASNPRCVQKAQELHDKYVKKITL